MSMVDDPRHHQHHHQRSSFTYSSTSSSFAEKTRRTSLREMPSYRDEASRALNRADDLARLKEKLSISRELLHADPASKPWLRKTSAVPIRRSPSAERPGPTGPGQSGHNAADVPVAVQHETPFSPASHIHAVPQPAGDAYPHPHPPPVPPPRSRNLSRATSASTGDSSEYSSYSYTDNTYEY